jgi:hypothetical protein
LAFACRIFQRDTKAAKEPIALTYKEKATELGQIIRFRKRTPYERLKGTRKLPQVPVTGHISNQTENTT